MLVQTGSNYQTKNPLMVRKNALLKDFFGFDKKFSSEEIKVRDL